MPYHVYCYHMQCYHSHNENCPNLCAWNFYIYKIDKYLLWVSFVQHNALVSYDTITIQETLAPALSVLIIKTSWFSMSVYM